MHRHLRSLVVATILVFAASMLPLSAQETVLDARTRQEELRAQAAETAAALDLLRAEDEEVTQALADLEEYVVLQEARLEAAEQALQAAESEQAAASEEAAELEGDIDRLKSLITSRSVEAYVQGSTPDTLLLESSDPTDALVAEVLVSEINGFDTDTTDLLRVAEAEQQAAILRAEDAAQRALERRLEIDDRLAELESARAAHQAVQAEIATRIATLEAEAATLAEEDARIGEFIRAEQERAAEADRLRRLEEQRQAEVARQAEAQARAAREATEATAVDPDTASGDTDASSAADDTETTLPTTTPTPNPPTVANPNSGLIWPANGPVVSSFGNRVHPVYGTVRFHAGHDIDGPTGTPVWSAGSGVVIFAGWRDGYGNTVIIDHGNGLSTLYGHLSVISIGNGASVSAGTPIGQMGATGLVTGPHLHFEVRVYGTAVNPSNYLP